MTDYAAAARARKVRRVARVLLAAGARPPLTLSDEDWARAAVIAGVRPLSATSRAAVVAAFAAAAGLPTLGCHVCGALAADEVTCGAVCDQYPACGTGCDCAEEALAAREVEWWDDARDRAEQHAIDGAIERRLGVLP